MSCSLLEAVRCARRSSGGETTLRQVGGLSPGVLVPPSHPGTPELRAEPGVTVPTQRIVTLPSDTVHTSVDGSVSLHKDPQQRSSDHVKTGAVGGGGGGAAQGKSHSAWAETGFLCQGQNTRAAATRAAVAYKGRRNTPSSSSGLLPSDLLLSLVFCLILEVLK